MPDHMKGWGWYVGDMSHVDDKGKPTGLITAVIFQKNGGPKRYSEHGLDSDDAVSLVASAFCDGEGIDRFEASYIARSMISMAYE